MLDESQPARSLTLPRINRLRCVWQLLVGAFLHGLVLCVAAITLAIWVGFESNPGNHQAALVPAGVWLGGYAAWAILTVKPLRTLAHELEVCWTAGGMLLAALVVTPCFPNYNVWIGALQVDSWVVFALPPTLWGFLARRRRRLEAHGWSEDPPLTRSELRTLGGLWGLAVLALGVILAIGKQLR